MSLLALFLFPSDSTAATEPFSKFCLSGSAAAQCDNPRGVAASPLDGHLFVVDRLNERINEFTAWGGFIKSWGWGVDTGAAALETCTTESGCQKGIEGTSGVGQFAAPMGVAVDSAGNVYVSDLFARRVQKFSPEGDFLLMFGGGVNQGPNNPGNVCTAAHIAGGDTCGAGTPGSGNGQFSASWPFSSNMAIGPNDEIYVGDKGRIQEFNTSGVFQRMLPDPDQVLRTSDPEVANGKTVGSLAVDPVSGDIYLAYFNNRLSSPAQPDVFRLDEETGELLDTIEVEKPAALATDATSNLYVLDQLRFSGSDVDPLNHSSRILIFDDEGNLIEKIGETKVFDDEEITDAGGIATGSFCFNPGENGLYLAVRNQEQNPQDFVQAYGPAPNPTPDPAKCEPPDVPPEINGEFAATVDTDSADLRAEINPRFFTEPVGTTTYYVQWGTATCIEDEGFEGTCADQQPLHPGAVLDSPPTNVDVLTDPIILEGLAPNTAYAYRFVAERDREDPEAEPLIWIVKGPGATFTTMPTETFPLPACPNEASRSENEGAGLRLRDCRAYELVSPTNKSGGDIQARLNIVPFEARVDQASLTGNEITFSAYRAFQNPESAPFSSQYLTKRTESGWETEAISPPQEGEAFVHPLIPIDNLYRAFSPDLKHGWLMTDTEPVLGEGGLAGHPNLYRRTNATETYDACTTVVPHFDDVGTQAPQYEGFSADGELAVFRVENKLTDNASEKLRPANESPIYQVYACSFAGPGPAVIRLISALPDGTASDRENTAGGPANEKFQLSQGRTESLSNAVSADGSKVFWTANDGVSAEDPGALYVRLNPAAEPTASGACEESEPTNACTVLISSGPAARFWTAAEDGSVAIFTEESGANAGDLNEYVVATGETLTIAEEVIGILGSSEDATRIYFLSEDEIGGEGTAGEPNLYLYDKGAETTTYLATLSEQDAVQEKTLPAPANPEPAWHSSRVTPDGSAVAFMSNDPELAEEVAGYDNTDQGSGLPAAEIYRFEIGGEVVCVSCNRTGQRPQGRDIKNKFLPNTPPLFAASMLPTWLNALYASRVLSEDGNRIFFEAFESLSLQDTNEKTDVYQWEAEGKGTCTEADSAFDPQSQGCVSLLTSGKATTDAQFIDASPSGNDVFLRTPTSLVSWDPGAIDIYDARVNGGLPAPPPPPDFGAECEGEGCQPPATPAPAAQGTATGGPSSGNVVPKAPVKKCRKGTHRVKKKGRVVCVRNKKGKTKAR